VTPVNFVYNSTTTATSKGLQEEQHAMHAHMVTGTALCELTCHECHQVTQVSSILHSMCDALVCDTPRQQQKALVHVAFQTFPPSCTAA
jgi:hypothetical protein